MNLDNKQKIAINAEDSNIVLLSSAGSGKACPNSTKIPTPKGWTTVGEVKVGDYLFDRNGNPTKVLGVYPQGEREVYEITFGDGRKAKCSKDHIWSYYKIPNGKRLYSKTLEEIFLEGSSKLNKYKNKAGKYCYQIPLIEKAKYPEREYSIPPYILGLFLGDGSFREKAIMFSSENDFLPKKIATIMNWDYYRHKVNKYCWYFKRKEIQKNGNYEFYRVKTSEFLKIYPELINKKSEEKFIPEDYLMGSVEQRIELLRGLLDTDGSIGEGGNIRYTTVSEKLCKNILSLIYSLGFKGGYYIENKGENKNKAYHISIQCSNQEKPKLFSVPKKYQRAIKISNKKISHYSNTNPIIDIKKLNYKEEMTCFYVDNKEHLFAINDWCITHNTTVLTERVKFLRNKGVPAKDIVCISFSNLAAEEIRSRLDDEVCKEMFIGTIHSYANYILKTNGIDLSIDINMGKFDKILEKALTLPKRKFIKVKHLLIDEFQDTGDKEWEFIQYIPYENIYLLGDERQCIYRFNGCTDQYLKDCYYNPNFTTYYLNTNYRCSPNFVSFADEIVASLDKISPPTKVARKSNGVFEKTSFLNALEECQWQGNYRQWAILCRTNAEIESVSEILAEKKIPFVTFKNSELSFQEKQDLLKKDAIKLLTIHTSKGSTFDHVIVVGAKLFNVEERCISYVAATRAKYTLFWCPQFKKKRNQPKTPPSTTKKMTQKTGVKMVQF